jgi:hypothetical protein
MVADATFGMGNAAAGRACSLIIAIFRFLARLLCAVKSVAVAAAANEAG